MAAFRRLAQLFGPTRVSFTVSPTEESHLADTASLSADDCVAICRNCTRPHIC